MIFSGPEITPITAGDVPAYSRSQFTEMPPPSGAQPGVPTRVVVASSSWEAMMTGEGRELYRSPNGDRWSLVHGTSYDRVLVRHEPNRPSGGQVSVTEVSEFLNRAHGPEQQALLRLIGSFVETEADV
jgi:hypothetical protein